MGVANIVKCVEFERGEGRELCHVVACDIVASLGVLYHSYDAVAVVAEHRTCSGRFCYHIVACVGYVEPVYSVGDRLAYRVCCVIA